MLSRLWVRDIVLMESADIAPEAGLSVLTGETGAGKSILLDALGLALGRRGDGSLVRAGAERGAAAACFSLAGEHPARELIERRGVALEEGEPVILRRVQEKSGATRAFLNDQPVGVALLREVGEMLVDVLGQNDVRGLLDPKSHRAALDDFGDLGGLIAAAQEAFAPMRDLEARLEEQDGGAEEGGRLAAALAETDRMLEEMATLAPALGEEADLARERTNLMQAAAVREDLAAAADMLEGTSGGRGDGGDDDNLETRVATLLRRLARISARMESPPRQLEAAAEALERALPEIAEARGGLEALLEAWESYPERLDSVERRLFALRALARRHEIPCDGLPARQEELRTRRAEIVDEMARSEALREECARARDAYEVAANALSQGRRDAAERLDAAVSAQLRELRLGHMKFRTRIALQEGSASAEGRDQVRFEVAPEEGTEFGPLARIASGGELSRFMLAVRAAIVGRRNSAAAAGPVCMIFDEIDQGVGGAVADAVGARLQALADSAQVLVVTHAPQIAARAAHHFRVSRNPVKKGGGGASASVAPLDAEERREEIARMLAGASISEEARAAASRLLHG